MNELLIVLIAWVASASGLPPTPSLPSISYASPARLAALSVGKNGIPIGEVAAVYDSTTSTIILRPDWRLDRPADVSVLVHELVHHLQFEAGLSYECPEAREAEAYAVQARWLEEFHLDLESSFAIDGLTLLLRTKCLPL